ncbi:hypothetical protein BJ981_007285 [Sphaerisporangium krabiense]|uniref:Uncharacterized protein n=1 Tax=Sphaerisporangium krabiense TaxID=763782 RepID=A0A7W8ZCG7_9ACTN|nr:hypothetical protein [Sphaerisporangium krabiense]
MAGAPGTANPYRPACLTPPVGRATGRTALGKRRGDALPAEIWI